MDSQNKTQTCGMLIQEAVSHWSLRPFGNYETVVTPYAVLLTYFKYYWLLSWSGICMGIESNISTKTEMCLPDCVKYKLLPKKPGNIRIFK